VPEDVGRACSVTDARVSRNRRAIGAAFTTTRFGYDPA
jgi:hypothetical protein